MFAFEHAVHYQLLFIIGFLFIISFLFIKSFAFLSVQFTSVNIKTFKPVKKKL